MGLFSPSKRAKHKSFSYEPRFYDPKKDEDMRRRLRVKRTSRHRRRDKSSLLYLLLLLGFAAYIYYLL